MKIKKTRISFRVHRICHCRVIALFISLSQGHDIWITDCVLSVDDLINFGLNSLNL